MPKDRRNGCMHCHEEENLIDTLIAISVISRILAEKIRKENDKNERNERTVPAAGRPDCLWN